ncbi:MAG: hypothetical protein QN187_01335 [Armatimonadota bacterium]|nr:hypothetical protein [Armatimonadota bacterium]MDR7520620.1 hypothetical protein [Armatimonadota bacterium]MDR7550487.1 hypothetical protein [Armatimonadota bacterium]
MRTLRSWAVFAAAVVSFSRLWQGVRAALEGERLYGPLEALFWMGLFLGSMGYLAFLIYAADRAAGRTRRPMPLFDRLLDRRAGSGEVGARGR